MGTREAYLDKVQQLIQVLHLISLRFTVVSAGVQAGALDGASVQGQIHGFSIQLDGLVAHRLVHVAVQLICCTEEKTFEPLWGDEILIMCLINSKNEYVNFMLISKGNKLMLELTDRV